MNRILAAVLFGVLGLCANAIAAGTATASATANVSVTVASYVSIAFEEPGAAHNYSITIDTPGVGRTDTHNVKVTSNTHGWIKAGVAMNLHPLAPTLRVTPKLTPSGGSDVTDYDPGVSLPIAVTVTALTTMADAPGVYTGTLTVTATNDV